MSTVAPDNPTSLEVFSLPSGDYLVAQEPSGLATTVSVQTHQFVTRAASGRLFTAYDRLPEEGETLESWRHGSTASERQRLRRSGNLMPELSLQFSPGLLEHQQKERQEVARVFGRSALNVIEDPAASITVVRDLKELGIPTSSVRIQYNVGSLIP